MTCARDLLNLSEFDVLGLACIDETVNYEDVEMFFEAVARAVAPPFHSAFDLDGDAYNGRGVSGSFAKSGVDELDAALGGGFRVGQVTELVGQAGVGKTQFCMTCSILVAASGKQVVYIDTENKFRPQRLMEIVRARASLRTDLESIGQNIYILTASTSEELDAAIAEAKIRLLDSSSRSPGMLVVDSMASLSESIVTRNAS